MPRQDFPKRLRLLTAGDYRGVFGHVAFKVHGKGMMALAAPNARGHPRLGLIVSRRNVKRAVDRNRFKRLVRESLRLRQVSLPAVDVVVLAKRGVQDLDNAQVQRQLHGLWKRLSREANGGEHRR